MESDAIRTLNVSTELSVEQIIQCNGGGASCSDYQLSDAYDYLASVKGLVSAADYPYTSYDGTTGTCHVDTNKAVVAHTNTYGYYPEDKMASHVQSTGPLTVWVYSAADWNTYTGGVMTVCSDKYGPAYVQAVGVDASSDGYWKIRNSWGTGWGEAGFIRLAYGNDTCGIARQITQATFFSVRKA
jgi:hypothetical protein